MLSSEVERASYRSLGTPPLFRCIARLTIWPLPFPGLPSITNNLSFPMANPLAIPFIVA